jgi:hypothetical protein
MSEAKITSHRSINLSAPEMTDAFQSDISDVVTFLENQIKLYDPLLNLLQTVSNLSNLVKFP